MTSFVLGLAFAILLLAAGIARFFQSSYYAEEVRETAQKIEGILLILAGFDFVAFISGIPWIR